MTARVNKRLLDLGVGAVAVLLVLLAGEAIGRLAVPAWTPPSFRGGDFWQHDDLLGWRHRPDQEGRFIGRDFEVAVATNSHGLRDREHPLAPLPGTRRAVLLGDSYGWGWGVDQDATLDAVIERRHPGLEVINCSVMGYGTDQEYLILRDRCLAFRPHEVVLLFTPNDVHNNRCAREYRSGKPLFELDDAGRLVNRNPVVTPPDGWQRLETLVLTRTYFVRRLYLGLWQIADTTKRAARRAGARAASGQGGAVRPDPHCTQQSPYEITAALLRAIRDLAHAHGASFAVAAVPAVLPGESAILDFLRQRLDEDGIPYLSLEEAFAAAGEPTAFAHDVHWNAAGHRLAAGVIGRYLAAR